MTADNHSIEGRPDGVSYQNLQPGLFLERSARVYPQKPAVVYGNRAYTYEEFDRRISMLAGALTAAGVGPEDRVGQPRHGWLRAAASGRLQQSVQVPPTRA